MPELTGGILAGGGSRRMGGQDKAVLLLDGVPLIQHVAQRLRPLVGELLINTRSTNPLLTGLADRCVKDADRFAGQGPLTGIQTLLAASATPWMLIVPCDAPLVPVDALQALIDSVERHAKPAVIRVKGRVNPVCCALSRDCLPAIEASLSQGRQHTGQVIASLAPEFVDHDDDRPGLWSLNTADELAACASTR